MKTSQPRFNSALFKLDGDQPIRVIKAAQASKLFNGLANGNGNGHAHSGAEPHKKPEIRMVHAGADYCDLEVVCGCGESTKVRCWNTPAAQQQAAA